MALRWSKTPGAYKRYRNIFERSLPVELPTDSPISHAGVIRDVIKFAAENNLPGGNWYKAVVVSPQEGRVIIREKKHKTVEITYPFESLFSLLSKLQEGSIADGYRFTSDTPASRPEETLSQLGFQVEDNLMYLQLDKRKEAENEVRRHYSQTT